MQHKRLESLTSGEEVNVRSERSYEKTREELVATVQQVRLHNNRIEELVTQLKQLNQRLTGLEGQLLRMAESVKVPRDDFLTQYRGSELDPNWVDRLEGQLAVAWQESPVNLAESLDDATDVILEAPTLEQAAQALLSLLADLVPPDR